MNDSISALTARIQTFVDDRDWRQFHSAKDLSIAIDAKINNNQLRYPVEKARGNNLKYNEL